MNSEKEMMKKKIKHVVKRKDQLKKYCAPIGSSLTPCPKSSLFSSSYFGRISLPAHVSTLVLTFIPALVSCPRSLTVLLSCCRLTLIPALIPTLLPTPLPAHVSHSGSLAVMSSHYMPALAISAALFSSRHACITYPTSFTLLSSYFLPSSVIFCHNNQALLLPLFILGPSFLPRSSLLRTFE